MVCSCGVVLGVVCVLRRLCVGHLQCVLLGVMCECRSGVLNAFSAVPFVLCWCA